MSNTFSCGFQCPSLQGNYPRKLEFIDCVRGALPRLKPAVTLRSVTLYTSVTTQEPCKHPQNPLCHMSHFEKPLPSGRKIRQILATFHDPKRLPGDFLNLFKLLNRKTIAPIGSLSLRLGGLVV